MSMAQDWASRLQTVKRSSQLGAELLNLWLKNKLAVNPSPADQSPVIHLRLRYVRNSFVYWLDLFAYRVIIKWVRRNFVQGFKMVSRRFVWPGLSGRHYKRRKLSNSSAVTIPDSSLISVICFPILNSIVNEKFILKSLWPLSVKHGCDGCGGAGWSKVGTLSVLDKSDIADSRTVPSAAAYSRVLNGKTLSFEVKERRSAYRYRYGFKLESIW